MKKRSISLLLALLMILLPVTNVFAEAPVSKVPENLLEIDWDKRHTYDFYEELYNRLLNEYKGLVEMESIGNSYGGGNKDNVKELKVLRVTNNENKGDKKGIGIFGNIHGDEHCSGEAALYTLWWILTNNTEEEVKQILTDYELHFLPVINPDGYIESFNYPIRQHQNPEKPYRGKYGAEPYEDLNGDGYVSHIYLKEKDENGEYIKDKDGNDKVKFIGMEGKDNNGDGYPGAEPERSRIDLNRTFDFMYPGKPEDAAAENEVKYLQKYIDKVQNTDQPLYAMVTLHTWIQGVLYPWCYAPQSPDGELNHMKQTAAKMARAMEETSGRRYYARQSNHDYPTKAEMIDWTYGKHGIRSYTMEVYRRGESKLSDDVAAVCAWDDEEHLPKGRLLTPEQVEKDNFVELLGLKNVKNEDLTVWVSRVAQLVGVPPVDQKMMLEGAKEGILEMIRSEANQSKPVKPEAPEATW